MSDPSHSPVQARNPPGVAVLTSVVLDTDDPVRLAEFYAALLGWQVAEAEDDWAEICPPTGLTGAPAARLAFQLVISYVPPTWPGQTSPQQFHLDLAVADLDEAERLAVALGASRVSEPARDGASRVYLDPSGHPFCLCPTW